MGPRNDVKLPRWAKLVNPKKSSSCVESEDVYLRKRCFHILSKQMEQTMDAVIQDALAPSVRKLEQFLDASSPFRESPATSENSTSRKRQRITPLAAANASKFLPGLDPELFDSFQEPDVPHDPLLFPVIILQGPSYGPDRTSQLNHICRALRSCRKRSAIVTLQKKCSKSRFYFLQELVQQCHQLMPVLSVEPLRRRIIKRQKKKALTLSDLLLLWAQHVKDFDDIVVLLDAEDNFYGEDFQNFLHLMANMRAMQGVPLNIVMLGPHDGRRNLQVRSTCQGYAGFMTRSISLPSTDFLLEGFTRKLWIERKFPILFPLSVSETIQSSFVLHHKSTIRFFSQFQQALAHVFAQPLSFLLVQSDPLILANLWQRIAWYLVDENGRNNLLIDNDADFSSFDMLCALDELEILQKRSQLITELRGLIHERGTYQTNLQPMITEIAKSTFPNKLSRKQLLETIIKVRERPFVVDATEEQTLGLEAYHRGLFRKCVTLASSEKASEDVDVLKSHRIEENQNLMNELVVLVGNCRDGDDLFEIEQVMEEISKGSIHPQPPENVTSLSALNFPAYDWKGIAETLSSEPRKQTVRALFRSKFHFDSLEGFNTSTLALPLAKISGVMYSIVHDRVAVPQEEWYEEFWQKAIVEKGLDISRETSFVFFSLGLRFLKQCGLITEKLRIGSRTDIIHERSKLVWCNLFGC